MQEDHERCRTSAHLLRDEQIAGSFSGVRRKGLLYTFSAAYAAGTVVIRKAASRLRITMPPDEAGFYTGSTGWTPRH
jgi:hypothetical protein